MAEKHELIVRTLGDFTITWQDRQISGGSRDSQFSRLMGILLHYSETGVERGRLEDMLFEDSSSEDPHHMLRSVIYNAKKKLQKAGLPAGCIEFHSGVYGWTKEIPVVEDARVFEKMVQDADREEDPAKRMDLYLHAVCNYHGEFLPDQTRHIWVMQEDRRYRQLFIRCMEEMVDYYRGSNDYRAMRKVGKYASMVSPLSDWETITMEALMGLNKYEEARDLYENTVDYYMEELGVKPAFTGTSVLDQIASQMENDYGIMDDIQPFLSGEDNETVTGGYMCSLPVFQGIYQAMERMISRGGQSVYLVLCTIVTGKGNPMKDGAVLNRLSERLADAIITSVRHSDVVCRYNKSQYLIMLINTTREDCSIVEDRINRKFKTEGQRTRLRYNVSNVEGKYL